MSEKMDFEKWRRVAYCLLPSQGAQKAPALWQFVTKTKIEDETHKQAMISELLKVINSYTATQREINEASEFVKILRRNIHMLDRCPKCGCGNVVACRPSWVWIDYCESIAICEDCKHEWKVRLVPASEATASSKDSLLDQLQGTLARIQAINPQKLTIKCLTNFSVDDLDDLEGWADKLERLAND